MLQRPCNHLSAIKSRYPNVWKEYDVFLAGRGKDLPSWPGWCYCPLSAAYAIASRGGSITADTIKDVAILGALAAWRPTQGIYRFDKDVASAIMSTEIDGEVPSDILLRLPEWCVYIEVPFEISLFQMQIVGFYAHLEWDVNSNRRELRFLLDAISPVEELVGIPADIDRNVSLADAMKGVYEQIAKNFNLKFTDTTAMDYRANIDAKSISPFVSLVLYLCSKNAEARNAGSGIGLEGLQRPALKKTKLGLRYFPPDRPEVWEVGFEIGKQIRAANNSEYSETHTGPRPHIRRAHWHTFWELTKAMPEKRSTNVKWLPPMAINAEDGEIFPRVRVV